MSDSDPCTYYKVNVFNCLLDAVLVDFTDKFASHFSKTASLCAIIPRLTNSKTWLDLKPAFDKYSCFLEDAEDEVKFEFNAWQRHWDFLYETEGEAPIIPESAISALNSCPSDIFPNIHILLNILSTLPVTTCEAERIFSTVNTTLTAIRCCMGEERLESLLLMQSNRDNLPKPEEVLSVFATSTANQCI